MMRGDLRDQSGTMIGPRVLPERGRWYRLVVREFPLPRRMAV